MHVVQMVRAWYGDEDESREAIYIDDDCWSGEEDLA